MNRTFTRFRRKPPKKSSEAAPAPSVEPASLYNAVKLDASLLTNADNRIPCCSARGSLRKSSRVHTRQQLQAPRSMKPSRLRRLTWSVTARSTVRLSARHSERVARYHSIWTDGALFTLESSNDTSAIVYRYADTFISEHRQDSDAFAHCRPHFVEISLHQISRRSL